MTDRTPTDRGARTTWIKMIYATSFPGLSSLCRPKTNHLCHVLHFCRYSRENFPRILKLVDTLQEIAKRHNATAGQVTLAWLLAQGNNIIPIPGTTKVKVRRILFYLACTSLNSFASESQGEFGCAQRETHSGGSKRSPHCREERWCGPGASYP